MFDGCNWSSDWLECLDCKFLSLPACPLEGSDAIDKIANRIRAKESGIGGASDPDTLSPALDELTPMSIKIMYNDESLDTVTPRHLAELIISKKIKRFLRAEGWVTVGLDPIRGKGGAYYGPERRNSAD